MASDDLTALTAAEIGARVREGLVSALDVARAHLARIADRGPALGLRDHDPGRVLAEAGGVDSRPDRFALPLAGVPVVITDRVDVSGCPARSGSSGTDPPLALRDDELVKRLRAAGAVVVGRTRTPSPARRGGRRAPRDRLSAPPDGGGCGGAAAVAAGMAALALDADGGGGVGSVRVQAARWGLVGLTPGAGLVPLPGGGAPGAGGGVAPGGGAAGQAAACPSGLTVVGPVARTAGDAALMLAVLIAGPCDLDGPGPRRIALSTARPSWAGRLHPDHRAAAVGAAARLRAGPAGAVVIMADPPRPRGSLRRWVRGWPVGAVRALPARRIAEQRTRMIDWLDEGGYDLLVVPATTGPPDRPDQGPRHLPARAVAALRRCRAATRTTASGDTERRGTGAWTIAGLPTVVAPVLVGGRPVGVALVGRPGSEAVLLAAAARLEQRAVPMTGAAPRRTYA